MTRPLKRSFSLDGHRTSVSLEASFWEALQDVAREQDLSLAALVQRIDHARGKDDTSVTGADRDIGLSGAIRVYLLAHFRARAGERIR
jgi:predicted DNA-binding ribbon-helix-helix protein